MFHVEIKDFLNNEEKLGVSIYHKDFDTKKFYFQEKFYRIFFWKLSNNPDFMEYLPLYLKKADRLIFIPGKEYNKEDLIKDLQVFNELNKITKILLIRENEKKEYDDLIEPYGLIPQDLNEQSLKYKNNLMELFLKKK